jgi:hypothetical protein
MVPFPEPSIFQEGSECLCLFIFIFCVSRTGTIPPSTDPSSSFPMNASLFFIISYFASRRFIVAVLEFGLRLVTVMLFWFELGSQIIGSFNGQM